MTDQTPPAPPARTNLAPVVFAFDIAYFDGTAHHVRTRPGDTSRMDDHFGATWRDETNKVAPSALLYFAWLASRHDPTGLGRPDFDTFRDDAVSVEVEVEEVRPTGAALGNDSPSTWQLPPEPDPANGSRPTLEPL